MTAVDVSLIPATGSHEVLGRTVPTPVEVRAATAAMGSWLVPLADLQRLVAPSGLEAMPTIAGRGMATVGLIQYEDNDLGDYAELAVAYVVRDLDDPKAPATLIAHMPVDQEFTCAAGRQIWGFPKCVADLRIDRASKATAATLVVDGRHVLSLRIARGLVPLPARDLELGTFTNLDGTVRRTRFAMHTAGTSTRVGGATLVLGTDHPLADDLRSLGLDRRRAAFTTHVAQLRATFHDAVAQG